CDKSIPTVLAYKVMNITNYQVQLLSRNRFVASCRLASYRSSLTHFTDVEIANFDDSQIRLFINNWFSSDLDERVGLAALLWEELNKPQNILAKELAQTPLLLTFLCMVYDRSKKLPGNRSVLYQKSLDILLEEWAAEKRIQLGDIYDGISTELEKLLLSEIAYRGFQRNQFFFREQDLVDQIDLFLEETLAPNDVDSKKVLGAIVEKQGVFVERAEGIFSFSHLTIQEYLTALYISQDYRRVKDAVSQYSIQKEWKDIFLLTAGLLHTADELIEIIEKESSRYIKTEDLKKRLRIFSEEAEKLNLNLCPAAKRAAVLLIAISCRVQAQSFPKSKSLAACRNHALFLFNALSADFNSNHNRAFRSKYSSLLIDDSVDRSIHLDTRKVPESLTAVVEGLDLRRSNLLFSLKDGKLLSEDDIRLLRTYLYMNELAVRCKEAATRISRDKWEEIESILLLIDKIDRR
ncbi:MAG: histidine kinase, partial [Bacteroidota bacterium]